VVKEGGAGSPVRHFLSVTLAMLAFDPSNRWSSLTFV